MRSYGRIATPLLVLALVGGCYNGELWDGLKESATAGESLSSDSDDSAEVTGVSTVTGNSGATSEGDTSGGGTGGGGSVTMGTDSNTEDSSDGRPFVAEFTVNGETELLEVPKARQLLLEADVKDDVVRVDFFWDGALLGSDEEAPYVWEYTADSDVLNGLHDAYAVAYDEQDANDASSTVKVDIQLPLSGSSIWERVDAATFSSKAHGIACDSTGNVYVVGQTSVSLDEGKTRITIRKHRDDGDLEWTRHIPKAGDASLGFSVARGLAIDSLDNVYVVGEFDPEDDGGHLWIGKFSSDGLLIAEYIDPIAYTLGRAIVVDPTDDDRIFVVGYYEKLNSESGFISSFDSGLQNPIWSDVVDDPTIADNRLFGLAMNSDGDLVASGAYRQGDDKERALLLKYDAKGESIWTRVADSPPEIKDLAFNVAVTKDDEIIGIGRQKGNGFEEALWTFRLDSAGDNFESSVDTDALCGIDGCSVTIDASGNHIFAGAFSKFKGAQADALLRKMSPHWLESLWSESVDGYDGGQDRSLDVAVDLNGFVYGAGFKTKDELPHWWLGKFNP